MKAKYNSEYHLNYREYNSKSYEERGCLTKRLRYLEKRVGVEPTPNVRLLSKEEIAEKIFELEKNYNKTNKTILRVLEQFKS